jgi:predicted ferric reductase
VIEPVGHRGFSFEPGQFGWIIFDASPFSTSNHPFSFSSVGDVEDGGRVALTIKAAGDFTDRIGDVKTGTKVYVDGPHGVFSIDERQAQGYVFIAGGVGVTPLYSMAVTMRDRGDVRPVILLCANRRWDDIVMREELAALEASMPNLTLIHVLQEPPPQWAGKTGRITPDLLKECLPAKQFRRFEYFVCGSNQMMDAMEDSLVAVGVPYRRVNTERFDMD